MQVGFGFQKISCQLITIMFFFKWMTPSWVHLSIRCIYTKWDLHNRGVQFNVRWKYRRDQRSCGEICALGAAHWSSSNVIWALRHDLGVAAHPQFKNQSGTQLWAWDMLNVEINGWSPNLVVSIFSRALWYFSYFHWDKNKNILNFFSIFSPLRLMWDSK